MWPWNGGRPLQPAPPPPRAAWGDSSMQLPGPGYTRHGIPRLILPELARLLERRRAESSISYAVLAARTGIDRRTLHPALDSSKPRPLHPDQYAAVAEGLGIMPRESFLRRCTDLSAAAACEELAVATRAALGVDGSVPAQGREPAILTDGQLLAREGPVVRLARRGFTAEALAGFAALAVAAKASENGRAHRIMRLNHGQTLVILSRLQEAAAEFAAVRHAARMAGDDNCATWASVLLADTLYELGRYTESLVLLGDIMVSLRAVMPAEHVGKDGPPRDWPEHSILPHDSRMAVEFLWWRVLHLRMKVLIERYRMDGVGRQVRYRAAVDAAATSRALSARLHLPALGHDLLWTARLECWAESPHAWAGSAALLDEAHDFLAGGVGPAYHHRAVGTRLAIGDDVDSTARAAFMLAAAAHEFAAHADARGLAPALSEAALDLIPVGALRSPGAEAQRQALALALAAVAFHPHGLVRHHVLELLGRLPPDAEGRAAVPRLLDDLIGLRSDAFPPVRRLARQLWAGDAEAAVVRHVRLSPFSHLLPTLRGRTPGPLSRAER